MARHHYETLQQVFDDAYRGLAAQGFRRSMKITAKYGTECAYRGQKGRRCAIGHCIPDDLYTKKLEGIVIGPASEDFPEAAVFDKLFDGLPIKKLTELQTHHDCWPQPEDMKNALENWARGEGLTIPSIEGAA